MLCSGCPHVFYPKCTDYSSLIEAYPSTGEESCKDRAELGHFEIVFIAHVCQTCGLSHRAMITKVEEVEKDLEKVQWGCVERCVCGAFPPPLKAWPAWLIGRSKPRNPFSSALTKGQMNAQTPQPKRLR